MSARSGQWSRWSATGTGTSRAISWNMEYRTRMPMDCTVLTDVCTMRGASACGRGGEHRLQGQVVDDVDGRDAIAAVEGVLQDL